MISGFLWRINIILLICCLFIKGLIIVWNKWDLIDDKDTHTVREFEKKVYEAVPQMEYIPIVTISATNKKRIHKVLELCDEVIEERNKQISTPLSTRYCT